MYCSVKVFAPITTWSRRSTERLRAKVTPAYAHSAAAATQRAARRPRRRAAIADSAVWTRPSSTSARPAAATQPTSTAV